MGDQWNSGIGAKPPQLSITDPKVCRSYLAGVCIHDLFTNTKQDFGPCPKTHSEALKAEYDAASDEQKRKWGFEFDYLREVQKYVEECNRRIDTAQRRLEKTPDEIRKTNALVSMPHLIRSKLTDSLIAQTNWRLNEHDRDWSTRNRDPQRGGCRQSGSYRILQNSTGEIYKGRSRT